MFINLNLIREAVLELEYIHPFFGITFLVCKKANLPIGQDNFFPIETLETDFLDTYFRIDKNSEYFYRLFRVSDKLKFWVHRTKYASSTLQSIRTRSAFSAAFIHTRGSTNWGWQNDYVGVLRANLSFNAKSYKNQEIPAFLLACWLYRDRDWGENTTARELINTFVDEFNISDEDQKLFNFGVDSPLFNSELLQPSRITEGDLKSLLGDPPDIARARRNVISTRATGCGAYITPEV